jgi:hypothetical protein
MSYEYDVFLSYPRDPDLEAWIDQYFIPRLYSALRNATLAACQMRMGKIYFDASGTDEALRRNRSFVHGIDPGTEWQKELERAMRVSRCMIALCSNTYFDSRWCTLELETFQLRQAKATAPIFVPISVVQQQKLPADFIQKYQTFDIHDYVVDGPSLFQSPEFVHFVRQIAFIAEKVANSICGAPAFEDWPIKHGVPAVQSPPVAVGRL